MGLGGEVGVGGAWHGFESAADRFEPDPLARLRRDAHRRRLGHPSVTPRRGDRLLALEVAARVVPRVLELKIAAFERSTRRDRRCDVTVLMLQNLEIPAAVERAARLTHATAEIDAIGGD